MVPSVTTILQRFKTAWAAQLHPDASTPPVKRWATPRGETAC
jgi:hypothetical protein